VITSVSAFKVFYLECESRINPLCNKMFANIFFINSLFIETSNIFREIGLLIAGS
jgi:hypothetical protein